MKNEKIIWIGISVIALLAIGFLSGLAVRKGIDSKRIEQYRQTVDELGGQLNKQAETNRQLTESNQILTDKANELHRVITSLSQRTKQAERIIANIRAGLSGDISTIREIKERLRIVIQAITNLGEKQ